MNIFGLLNQSETGKDFIKELSKVPNYNSFYRWIEKVNSCLEKSAKQGNTLKKKFQLIGNRNQLFDRLVEILIACEYSLGEEPQFCDDNKGGPDIYLRKSEKYVEVKRINVSDEQKSLIGKLKSNQKSGILRDISHKLSQQEKMNKSLQKKAEEHIKRAIKQMKGKQGDVCLVYSLDLTGYRNNLKYREKELEKHIKYWFDSLKLEGINLKIMKENDLFG